MQQSLTEYWSRVRPADCIHPDDATVWARLLPDLRNDCLLTPYHGRIIDAPVVLLFLSPGLSEGDPAQAGDPAAQDRYVRIRAGLEPLSTELEWPEFWRWWTARSRIFGTPERLRDSIAILNISAYKSREFRDYPALAALPSCQFNLAWAHRVLFPDAEAGRRVVVCMRAAKWWGLTPGHAYPGTLFAPLVNRAGDILREQGSGPARRDIEAAVKRFIGQ